jgi:hypothetical protein
VTDWKSIAVAALAGGAAAGLVWWYAKGELERDFGMGAVDLESRLRSSGTALQQETSTLCRAVARKAIDERLDDLGFTPALLRDTAQTLDTLNQLVAAAERLRTDPATLLRRLG